MRHLSYAVMLAVVLIGTLPLHRVFRLDLAGQLRRVAMSILPVAVVFVLWDVAATRATEALVITLSGDGKFGRRFAT